MGLIIKLKAIIDNIKIHFNFPLYLLTHLRIVIMIVTYKVRAHSTMLPRVLHLEVVVAETWLKWHPIPSPL